MHTTAELLRSASVPSNIISCLAAMGILLLVSRRFRRLSTTVIVIALISLVAVTLSPIGNVLLTPLEQRFPAGVFPDHVDGIIVLGGSYDTVSHGYLSTIVLNE